MIVVLGDEGPLAALCREFVAQAPVTGASFTLSASEAAQEILWASDPVAVTLARLQYDLGEGPALTAMSERRPVLVGDVEAAGSLDQWPVFASECAAMPVGALYMFPLQLGGSVIGVCDSYAIRTGVPSPGEISGMLRALDRLTATVLGSLPGAYEGGSTLDDVQHDALEGYDLTRTVIHQATGMVSVHLGVDVAEAFARLRAHAYGHGQHVQEVATAVVAGELRLGRAANDEG